MRVLKNAKIFRLTDPESFREIQNGFSKPLTINLSISQHNGLIKRMYRSKNV